MKGLASNGLKDEVPMDITETFARDKNDVFPVEDFVTGYQIVKAKTGHDVPVVNGISLHSLDDPIQEAQSHIADYRSQLKKKSHFFILGTGFGYHIEALIEALQKYHGGHFRIGVLELNKNVFEDCLIRQPNLRNPRIQYYVDNSIERLYMRKDLMDLLLGAPIVIKHPDSFNVYYDFYKSFLSYRSSTSIHEYLDRIKNANLRKHICTTISDDPNTTLSQYIENLRHQSRKLEKGDFILMTLDAMSRYVSSDRGRDEKSVNH